MKKLQETFAFSFSDRAKFSKVIVLGCGGTGAYIVSHLAKIIKSMGKMAPELVLVDGDIVEEKNLIRQHFVSGDLGKNKAQVLSQRYSSAFNMEISFIDKYIEDAQELKSFYTCSGSYNVAGITMVIGCVDNNATRKIIHNSIDNNRNNIVWIDSGNEEIAGQVICGCSLKTSTSSYFGYIFSLPFVTELYPEMLESDDKFASDLSCAERAQSAPQNIMTNVTAATLALNYIQSILLYRSLKSHGVTFNINNVFKTIANTRENLSKSNKARRIQMDYTIWERGV